MTDVSSQHAPRWINYTVVVSEEPYYDPDLLPEIGSQYGGDECGWEPEGAAEEDALGERRAPYFARPDQLRRMQAVPLGEQITICCHIKGQFRPSKVGPV